MKPGPTRQIAPSDAHQFQPGTRSGHRTPPPMRIHPEADDRSIDAAPAHRWDPIRARSQKSMTAAADNESTWHAAIPPACHRGGWLVAAPAHCLSLRSLSHGRWPCNARRDVARWPGHLIPPCNAASLGLPGRRWQRRPAEADRSRAVGRQQFAPLDGRLASVTGRKRVSQGARLNPTSVPTPRRAGRVPLDGCRGGGRRPVAGVQSAPLCHALGAPVADG